MKPQDHNSATIIDHNYYISGNVLHWGHKDFEVLVLYYS